MMARIVPDVDPASLEHSSEEPVFRALKEGLSNDFTVIHSYPWLRPWRGEGPLHEGEADFIVVHPRLGLLVLEVKGGDTIRHDGYKWFRDTAKGPREFKDPFRQAQRNMHALLDIVSEKSKGRISRNSLTYGYAVVFPHVDYEGSLPAHIQEAVVLSRRHLPFIEEAIEAAYRAWRADPVEIPRDRFQMLVYDCLMPQFRVFRPISADIGGVNERLLELTTTQAEVLEGLFENRRVLVKGVAGSGKTFLALHRALAFAREGKRTLFVCFNKALAAWIRRRVTEDPATASYRANLDVQHFHALAAKLARDANIPFEPESGGQKTQDFWDNQVPEIIEQAAYILSFDDTGVLYDAIVVDEAQDFSMAWWWSLSQTLIREADGPIYAFMDPNQSLRGAAEVLEAEFEASFMLSRNCRNTRKIATASAGILGIDTKTFARAPLGADPRLIKAPSQASMKGLVLSEVRKLLEREDVSPRQIALVGPAAHRTGSLADVNAIEGIPLVDDASAWQEGESLLVTTARSFKGLEADVVVLYDLSGFSRFFTRADLYVACTRPRAALIALCVDGDCRDALEEAVESLAGLNG